MREISVNLITDVVERLCIEANTHLPGDVKCAIETCRACEDVCPQNIKISEMMAELAKRTC